MSIEDAPFEVFGKAMGGQVRFTYGIPDESAITQEEAMELAENVLIEVHGRKPEEIRFFTYKHDVYYDITNPEEPLWKFFFWMPNEYVADKAYGREVYNYYGDTRQPNYKVELNAYTGELADAYAMDLADEGITEDWSRRY